MDLLYMSENFNYYSARGPIYEKYNEWDKPKVKEPTLKTKPQGQTTKGNCQLCRDNQKRGLSNYIRTKSIECAKKDGILEESEE